MAESELHLDFETRSVLDLKLVGVGVYANHPLTDAWCFAWAFDDEPVELWWRDTPIPQRVIDHIRRRGKVSAFNASFEWHIWNFVLRRDDPSLPEMDYLSLDCTMARAVVMGLPRSLEVVAYALSQKTARMEKDLAGRRLMLQMAKPRFHGPQGLAWWDDYTRRERLGAYCKKDVEVERWAAGYLRPLTETHRRLWEMDFRMNHIRGVHIDVPLIRRAEEVTRLAVKDLCDELAEITGGRCASATQVQKFQAWLETQGHALPNMQKETLEAALEDDDLPPVVRRALEIRQSVGKTSVAKIPAFLRRTDAKQRMRGMLLFNGAGPGRWTGQGAQLHNLPRPTVSKSDVLYIVRVLRNAQMSAREKVDLLNAVYGATLPCVSEAIRGFIVARPGHRLHVRDFANIEGRCIARIAGEDWKIKAFQAFDDGTGPDLYRVAAAGIFGCRVEDIDDDLRNVGKVSELALGFAGGAPALTKMARKYGILLVDYMAVIRSSVSNKVISRAEWGWTKYGFRAGIEENAWMAAEMVKLAWRDRHPAIVALWDKLVEAAMAAIREPGVQFTYRDVTYQYGKIKGHGYLLCRLPSGRLLYYPHAQIKHQTTQWNTEDAYISYSSTDPVTKRWCHLALTKNIAAENVTQGDAFDFLADAMLRCEQAGFPSVLSVHDENIAEAPEGANDDLFGQLMAERPHWAKGMPLAVAGFVDRRYHKA